MPSCRFPLVTAMPFAERIERAPDGASVRRWVLRDDNAQHYHGRLPLSEDPAYVELLWKPDSRGREQFVGLFRLHLAALLRDNYVRAEGGEVSPAEIRLRFHRGERGVIFIQSRSDQPALPVGVVDLTLD